MHKSCIYFKVYFDDGVDVEVSVDIDHLGGMTSIFLNSVYESFGSWLFVLELIWKRWRRRLFCRHQPRSGKVFVAKSGSSPPGAASHSSINKAKSEQSGNVEDFSTPRKTILWYIENYNANTYLVSKVAGPGILRIKTLRGIFPTKELSALWKRFQHTLTVVVAD